MRKTRIGIIDLVTKAPTRALCARVMHDNFPVLCLRSLTLGTSKRVRLLHSLCYTGFEDLANEVPGDVDIVFIGDIYKGKTAYSRFDKHP